MSQVVPNDAEKLRRYLFTPQETMEGLHAWIKVYLGLDFPNCKVDEDSTSSPMHSIWEVYDKARKNDDPDFNRILTYAARDSFKTLAAAVLEVLMIVHLGRSVAHMAAIEGQAKKSQQYVKKFLRRPMLREFVVGDNQRNIEILRYYNEGTGVSLSPKEYAHITEAERQLYVPISNYIAIIICTLQGANSEHVPFMTIDEVDVVGNPKAYEEAQAIPAPYEGKDPITLLTSTRKFSTGLVQKEIDRAHESGLEVRHWNIIDVTQRCPTTRHQPELPKIPIYHSEETLRAISEKDYKELDEEQQDKYVRAEGYQGCLDNCRIFAACKGRLATQQFSTSNLLKKVTHTQNQFKKFSPEMAKAQLLCWKPSKEGLIYPRLDRATHMKSAAEIAHMITGETYDPKMTKGDLIAMLKTREVQWFAGMDFGFTHNFAVVIGVKDGARMFIIDAFSAAELELGQKLEICERRLKHYDCVIFPDVSDPSSIKTFKRNGYRMREWDKGKGTVVGGIETMRLKMWPAVGDPELYFLDNDDDVALVFTRLTTYHWEVNAAGTITDIPNKEDDDEADATRYMVMNVFAPKGKIRVGKDAETPAETSQTAMIQAAAKPKSERENEADQWKQIMNFVGIDHQGPRVPTTMTIEKPGKKGKQGEPPAPLGTDPSGRRGQKGRFVWEM